MPAATTIPVGGVVKFVMSSLHDVAPNPIAPMSDPATVVPFGQTKCLRFDAAGAYGIYCEAHSFAGTITVSETMRARCRVLGTERARASRPAVAS